MSLATRVVIFAKAPLPGYAKTRLIPALGAQGAAQLAESMLCHAVSEACAAMPGQVELCVTPGPDAACWQAVRARDWPVQWSAQGEGDLGARLARAARRHLGTGNAVLLIGTDCPGLNAGYLSRAVRRLGRADAVLGPSTDGGYVLLGLKRWRVEPFEGIQWGSPQVAAQTVSRIAALGWSLAELPALSDVDEPGDLHALPDGWLERSPAH
ncbi:MAG: DUF2064 domain-containing protein [Wenzhouxiangellaceae bacterium]